MEAVLSANRIRNKNVKNLSLVHSKESDAVLHSVPVDFPPLFSPWTPSFNAALADTTPPTADSLDESSPSGSSPESSSSSTTGPSLDIWINRASPARDLQSLLESEAIRRGLSSGPSPTYITDPSRRSSDSDAGSSPGQLVFPSFSSASLPWPPNAKAAQFRRHTLAHSVDDQQNDRSSGAKQKCPTFLPAVQEAPGFPSNQFPPSTGISPELPTPTASISAPVPKIDPTMPKRSSAKVFKVPADPNTKTSGSKKDSKSSGPPKIPRPPNSWILYRSEMIKAIKSAKESGREFEMPKGALAKATALGIEKSLFKQGDDSLPCAQADVSKLISLLWKNETSAIKKMYDDLSAVKKQEHAIMYPEYRFHPVKKVSKGNPIEETRPPSPSSPPPLTKSTSVSSRGPRKKKTTVNTRDSAKKPKGPSKTRYTPIGRNSTDQSVKQSQSSGAASPERRTENDPPQEPYWVNPGEQLRFGGWVVPHPTQLPTGPSPTLKSASTDSRSNASMNEHLVRSRISLRNYPEPAAPQSFSSVNLEPYPAPTPFASGFSKIQPPAYSTHPSPQSSVGSTFQYSSFPVYPQSSCHSPTVLPDVDMNQFMFDSSTYSVRPTDIQPDVSPFRRDSSVSEQSPGHLGGTQEHDLANLWTLLENQPSSLPAERKLESYCGSPTSWQAPKGIWEFDEHSPESKSNGSSYILSSL
ncbi:HMG-box transcription factor SOX5 [Phaffia rhodozyma]|uniref:HMG-box transcription factor SOX5 n=1 Tax=Phaffia rhodozyma TaxID=264483 RepID=A0A0F7SMC4_PHARH|nr:HMG-box transcription factor SOX5 [Phaffia rhodozyma]